MRQAIDYRSIGTAIVRAVRLALDLGDQQVIFYQPEDAVAPRPALPYVSVYFPVAATAYGWDTSTLVGDDDDELITGPRSFQVTFESYAETHAESNGLITTLQAAIFAQSVLAYLRSTVGVGVWDTNDVTDTSKALETGFEGRAKMTVTFGVLSSLQLPSQGTIDAATVGGNTLGGDLLTIGDTDPQ